MRKLFVCAFVPPPKKHIPDNFKVFPAVRKVAAAAALCSSSTVSATVITAAKPKKEKVSE
jgi:hypothetical protein